jgi:thiol-disulfide isomerase/thioredoxin
MTPGAVVLLIAVAAALALGVWRLVTDGRFRGTHAVKGAPATDEHDESKNVWKRAVESGAAAGEMGERATLLQFSSAFCVPCRVTRRVMSEVAQVVPGIAHVDVDAEHHLELVRALGIMRTPTTLILDARGREVRRAVGAPRKEDVFAALVEAVT